MHSLTEGEEDRAITFQFPDAWKAIKYDAPGGYYKETVDKCQGMTAVDFLVLTPERQLWFEAKNFRGAEEENRIRLNDDEAKVSGLQEIRQFAKENGWSETVSIGRKKLHLADEVSRKVRDTCSALLGVMNSNENELFSYAESVCAKKPIHVVLYLQQDERAENEFRRSAQRLADKIKSQIRFLNATVEVVNSSTISRDAKWNIQN